MSYPTDSCPKCRAPDYHPDPSGPNGETWWICESCGYMVDHRGKVVDEGNAGGGQQLEDDGP